MDMQKSMSGKTKSKSYAYDDEKIIKRKSDGLITTFGHLNIRDIITFNIRNYIQVR